MRRFPAFFLAATVAMSGQLAFARSPTQQLYPSPPQPDTVINQIQVPQFVLTQTPKKED